MPDNFHFDIAYEGDENLRKALEIATLDHTKAVGYKVIDLSETEEFVDDFTGHVTAAKKIPTLLLYWYNPNNTSAGKSDGYNQFPCQMGVNALFSFCKEWLESIPENQIGHWIDMDGSLYRGWRVFNEDWGHVDGEGYAFAGIQPIWMWYGK